VRTWAWTCAAATLALLACGPLNSSHAISSAEVELRSAKVAGADTAAPYEYTEAEALLTLARECQGRGDFQASEDFARRAAALAKEGKENAPRNLKQREVRQGALKQGPSPAKAAPTTGPGGGK